MPQMVFTWHQQVNSKGHFLESDRYKLNIERTVNREAVTRFLKWSSALS